MDSSKFLIVGANGQLGKALQKQYPDAKAVDSESLNISDMKSFLAIDWPNITHVLNAAAYTNVDGAQSHEGRVIAWQVNSVGVGNLAKICKKYGITLIHISSEYVFDGTNVNHTEYEAFSPLSVYGSTKASGDLLAQTTDKYYILRTSWLIGDGNNFARTMMDLAQKNISPTVVHDQVGRLTFTSELVRVINHALTNNLEFGTYNVSNGGESASWADVTREIFTALGREDLQITNTTTAEYFAGKASIAPRPLQSTLDLTKIQSTGFQSTDWKTELVKYIKGDTN